MVSTVYYKDDLMNGKVFTKLYFIFKFRSRPLECFKNAHKANDHVNILSKMLMTFNRIQKDALLRGETVVFPYGLGKLQLTRVHDPIRYKNGKLKEGKPVVNWCETRKLWRADPEAAKKKTLVKQMPQPTTEDYIRVQYSAAYRYNKALNFKPCPALKRELRKRFIEHEIDAPIIDMTKYD